MHTAIRSLVAASVVLATTAAAVQVSATAKKLPLLTAEQEEMLSHMSIIYLDDGQGGMVKTVQLSGVNFRIVDGSHTTGGAPTGVGNLLVGYNEVRGSGDDRTGSHTPGRTPRKYQRRPRET